MGVLFKTNLKYVLQRNVKSFDTSGVETVFEMSMWLNDDHVYVPLAAAPNFLFQFNDIVFFFLTTSCRNQLFYCLFECCANTLSDANTIGECTFL